MSNLLRFVCEPRVVTSHLDEAIALPLMVFLEGARLEDGTGTYQSIARQIIRSARRFGWPRADLAALEHLANRSPDAEEGLSEIIAYLCENKQRRIVVAFDEFDAAFVKLPAVALRALRQLRDNHKDCLSYLVGTRRELTYLSDHRLPESADIGKFTELFDLHTFPVKPYTRQDAFNLVARKIGEPDRPPNEEQIERLYRATGGHAKLLVAGLTALIGRLHLPWTNTERALLKSAILAELCQGMWEDLGEGERAALRALATDRRSEIQTDDLALLRLKGLVVGRPDSIFSTLFEAFLKERAKELTPPATGDLCVGAEAARRDLPKPSRLRDPQESAQW